MEPPKSLTHFESYQMDYYNQLKQRPYFNEMASVIERFLRDIIAEGAFYLRVKASVLPQLLKDVRVKNMMETGTGATNGGSATRREVTSALFGCDVDALRPQDYPKYGYLSQSDPQRDLIVNSEFCFQYGSVALMLKKEKMMPRTTLTVGNSVNFQRCFHLIPTLVTKPLATCVCGLLHHHEHDMMPMENPLAFYYYLTVQLLEGKLTKQNFSRMDRLIGDAAPVFDFFELQYHGEINLFEDVERIDVLPDYEDDLPFLQQMKSEYESKGVAFHLRDKL